MGWFGKLMGQRGWEALKAQADRHYEAGELGEAKLVYDRALDRGRQAPAEAREAMQARIAACCDGLARGRVQEAQRLLAQGDTALAQDELESAREVARDTALQADIDARLEALERADAAAQVEALGQASDEERLAALAGSWEDAQQAEYDSYGESLFEAVLAMDDERYAEAHGQLETLLAQVQQDAGSKPVYLWLEVGKARLLAGENDAGLAALRTFLERLEPDAGGESRLWAHAELARAAQEGDDFEAAVAELQRAVEALPADPRPYLLLGRFLRQAAHPEQALETLDAAVALYGESEPGWALLSELGLCHADLGRDEQAVNLLERVVDSFAKRGHLDLPPEPAARLAELYEATGRLERAADLFSMLAKGSDRANLFRYHTEAGRLLETLGMRAEARRMLQRARELVPSDAADDVRSALEARLAALQG